MHMQWLDSVPMIFTAQISTFAHSMSYIFGKLWHLAIIWPIRKSFQCTLQGVRFVLPNSGPETSRQCKIAAHWRVSKSKRKHGLVILDRFVENMRVCDFLIQHVCFCVDNNKKERKWVYKVYTNTQYTFSM